MQIFVRITVIITDIRGIFISFKLDACEREERSDF